jgi:hypothetical protein
VLEADELFTFVQVKVQQVRIWIVQFPAHPPDSLVFYRRWFNGFLQTTVAQIAL